MFAKLRWLALPVLMALQAGPGAAQAVLPPQAPARPVYPYELPDGGPPSQAPVVTPLSAPSQLPDSGSPLAAEKRAEIEDQSAEEEIRSLKASDVGVYRFAQDLFDFRQSTRSAGEGGISDDYQLGVGDELKVFAFGSASFEVAVRVDGRGEIVVPKLGTIHVGGQTLQAAKAALQRKVNADFTNTRVDIQVSKLREVRVFVLGEVYRPGSYLVPSLSSLVNILSQAGGPTRQGSFRDIRVMRGDQVVHALDLYPLRLEGRGRLNVSLQSGDTIFVPLVGTRVLVRGEFTRLDGLKVGKEPVLQMSVELKPGERALDVVRLMGGIRPNAFSTFITLARRDPGGVLHVSNIPSDEATLARTVLFPEDALQALPKRLRTENVVEVEGYVRVPGTFAFTPGNRVADILKALDQTLPDSYLQRGQITRTHADESRELIVFNLAKALEGDPENNPPLAPRDRITLFQVGAMRRKDLVSVVGPVTFPGYKPWLKGLRASDLLFQAGLPLGTADRFVAELAHYRDGKPVETRRLDLSRLLSTEASSPVDLKDDAVNPLLEPYDQLSIFTKTDALPHASINLRGQVGRPGTYELDKPNITLKEIIERAGGLTPEAMLKGGILLRRTSGNDLEGKDSKDSKDGKDAKENPDPENRGISEILERLNETRRQPSTGQLLKTPILHDLSTSRLNRIIVDFPGLVEGNPDAQIELMNGDEIIIPRRTEMAYVVGESSSPYGVFRLKNGYKVRDLVARAGGFTRNADKGNVRLLKADGHILDSWVMSEKVEPGDAVLIPQLIRRDTTWQENLNALTPLALILNAIHR